ncbi:beta-ketoacyl-[acyl-carrier-protein] synthase family protein [Brevibacillus fulvus]|uniref:3-oxoacyl-[acyl-carrier-protein] synthase II n=1 Tax=Brevibacillus fulvus TaxID=1125967 RepID=A0A938XX82_9BACL|nr:beta-ketoacyl-[acyl-carrier-protein] synthase family protein [Brevibacillus fulvus]MBM7589556.1 3-oxoacyl-[acyl-carrier-protein] synthase II [Brevibacillus fulvus]
MKQRVVVTGLGAVTPVGHNVAATWDQLLSGQSGVGKIDLFDTEHFDTKIAAQVKEFTLEAELGKRQKRYLHRSLQFGIQAFQEAVADAGLLAAPLPSEEIGLAIGCGLVYPNLAEMKQIFDGYFAEGQSLSYMSPNEIMRRNLTTGISLMAEMIEATGPMISLTTACASSAHAIGEAFRRVQCKEATAMIAGGYDSMINYIDLIGFGMLGALSTRNDDPAAASRPFSRDRDGFVIGEGAAMLVLESLESALNRGAPIYGEVVGYSSTMNAYRITDSPPDGGSCITAMKNALNDAGLEPEMIDYIAAHGTGTPYNDFSETNAIKAAFGEHADALSISSIKSMIGHLTSAAGAINLLVTLLAIRDQAIPPTINLLHPDSKLDLDYVPNESRRKEVRAALVNAFAFGGTNACIAVRKWQEGDRT